VTHVPPWLEHEYYLSRKLHEAERQRDELLEAGEAAYKGWAVGNDVAGPMRALMNTINGVKGEK